jgi:hypothetical protein
LATSRASVVSSFTIIKGSLIDETYAAFQRWDLGRPKIDNLERIRANGALASASSNWTRDVSKVLNRRFDPTGRDRAVVELAKAGCDREVWKPILLWHMTRDEFLLRDFLVGWLYDRYIDGTYRIRTDDVVPYLQRLKKRRGVQVSGDWSEATTSRVASGLLRIAADFGLLTGTLVKEFTPFHVPEESFLYLLHAMAEAESNARKIVDSADWHMYLMSAADVERELFRLHQFRRLHYEVAGSLAQLELPCRSTSEYAKELAS